MSYIYIYKYIYDIYTHISYIYIYISKLEHARRTPKNDHHSTRHLKKNTHTKVDSHLVQNICNLYFISFLC